MSRKIITLNRVSDRNSALNVQIDGKTPVRWDRYEREWYIEDESLLPLYEKLAFNVVPGKRMSDIERQERNIREYTEKIFKDKKFRETFFDVLLRFRNMNLNNLLIIAGFNPEATVFKTFAEWNRIGVELNRSGMHFGDLYAFESMGDAEAQAESIVNSIAAKLEKKQCQRLAVYMIRKNEDDRKYFDILQTSYESEQEVVRMLAERQSKRELKEFIYENVLDQEIDFEKETWTLLYPDTSIDKEGAEKDFTVQTLPDADRLYNMLCWLCKENDIKFSENEITIEDAIKQMLHAVVNNLSPSVYRDAICMLLQVFYGMSNIYPELQYEGVRDYKQKRECLKDIKRNFDFVAYNIENYKKKERVYVFEPGDCNGTSGYWKFEMEDDVLDDNEIPETDFADIEDIYSMAFGEDSAIDETIRPTAKVRNKEGGDTQDEISGESMDYYIDTVKISKLCNMPQEPNKLEGIFIRRDDGDFPVKIEYFEGQLIICKSEDIIPFSLDEFNRLVDCGYEKIIETEETGRPLEMVKEDSTYQDNVRTPAEEEWIKATRLDEIHNVTLCFWQIKEEYKQRLRGVPYKVFHEILKEKAIKERYEKKIELTLRACENLQELKDSFYYQIFMESRERPVLEDYFLNGGPDTIYIGDLIEIYSSHDNLYSLNYIDVRGFCEIPREEFYGYEMELEKTVFGKQYEKDRILALMLKLKVDEQVARIINILPQSILRFPDAENAVWEYRGKGIKIAKTILSQIQHVPVLICNRCISMPYDDELRIKENNAEQYEKLCDSNRLLRIGKIIPFRKFCETVDAYQNAVKECRSKGTYQGYDVIDFLVWGKTRHDIYVYFSSIKTGEKYLPAYDYIKSDMNLQYGRLYEEYTQRRKRNGEKITDDGRILAGAEMDYYIQMTKAINAAMFSNIS